MKEITFIEVLATCNKNFIAKPRLGKNLRRGISLATFILIMFFVPVTVVSGQTPGTVEDAFNLPDPGSCVSKDLEVVSASLDIDNCSCEAGTTSYYDLILGINNKTGSTRTSYAFWARLTSTDPISGEETVYFVSGCQGPIAKKSTTYKNIEDLLIYTYNESTREFDPVYDPFDSEALLHQIPYTCGETLELSNIYQGWTDAADNAARQCPLDASLIAPKCGVTPSLRVDVGLSAASLDTNVSCNGEDDGEFTVSFVGGKAPYYFKLEGGTYTQSTSPKTFTQLSPGDYNWYVKDSNIPACEKTGTAHITEPAEVTLTTSSTNISCFGANDGSLSIDDYSGTGTPTFYLKTGEGEYIAKTEAEIEAITAAGDYVIKVTYPEGNNVGVCEKTSSESITEPAEVTLTTSSTNISCFGANDGSLSIDDYSGTGTPTFYLKTGEGEYIAKTEAEIEAITAAGDYVIKVTYPEGNNVGVCEKTSSESITEPAEVTLTTSSTNISCFGANDGSLSIDDYSGTGTPTFYLKTGEGEYIAKTEAEIEAITAAGDYVIKVTYPEGNNVGVCEKTSSESITEPAEVTLTTSSTNISCFGANDGSLSIDDYSGTGTPTFYLKTGEGEYIAKTEAEIEAITAAGDYVIKVTYPEGNNVGVCEKTSSESITEPDEIPVPSSQVKPADCINTSSDPEADPVYLGSVAFTYPEDSGIGIDFYYSYKEDSESDSEYSDPVAYPGPIDLAMGDYNFRFLLEVEGCVSDPIDVKIDQLPQDPLDITLSLTQPDCATLLGGIQVTQIGLLGGDAVNIDDYLFSLFDNNADPSDPPLIGYNQIEYPVGGFTNLSPGSYRVFALGKNGCNSGVAIADLIEPQCVECETAFGKDDGAAICFEDVPDADTLIPNENRWGWTNQYSFGGGVGEDVNTLNLYQGAANCEDGTFVGTVTLTRTGNTLSVEFEASANYYFGSIHLYVGGEPFMYKKQGKNYSYTVAPGQYNQNPSSLPSEYVTEYTISGIVLTGDYYVIAHVEACTSEYQNINEDNISSAIAGFYEPKKRFATMLPAIDDGSSAKTTSTITSLAETSDPLFSIAPVPFSDVLNIGYLFDYTSDVTIQIFDLNGRLLTTYKDTAVNSASISTFNVDFRTKSNQIYIVRMTTDREVYSAKIIAAK